MQLLVEYPWPGNVRELRNLIESMVVLAPGHEIQPGDLPRQIRDGGNARFLPVHVGPIVRGQEAASGRELEFIVRSLLELKLQVEELRRRMDDARATTAEGWIGDVRDVRDARPLSTPAVAAIEPREQASPPNVVTVAAGTKMADIERAAIEMALKETRGNRRRAAEMLGIGERTLYRKIKEYRMPEQLYTLD
jgi:DNA-binding NtrC family response regulator